MPTQGRSGKPTTRRYSEQEKAQAVRLVRQLRAELGTITGRSSGSRRSSVTGRSRCGAGCVRPTSMTVSSAGTTTADAARIKALEQEVTELRRTNAILRRRRLSSRRSSTAHRSDGRVHRRASRRVRSRAHLQGVAGGSEHVLRGEVSGRLSARAVRDAVLIPILMAIWVGEPPVYGAHKLWKAARRAGHDIGRDQVARLMRELGIEGVSRRRRKVRTTKSDPDAPRPPDLVDRDFTADAPNDLWVTDLTYVPTWSGMAYVCFIVDAFSPDDRRLAGRVAHADRHGPRRARDGAAGRAAPGSTGCRCHSDAGSQFTSVRYAERLAELGAVPSIGIVGDSYDNALAETVNGLYKTELHLRARPGTVDDDRRRRARDPRLGALAQHRTPPRLPRRRAPRRVRSRLLRCPRDHQRGSLETKPRASIKPRAIQMGAQKFWPVGCARRAVLLRLDGFVHQRVSLHPGNLLGRADAVVDLVDLLDRERDFSGTQRSVELERRVAHQLLPLVRRLDRADRARLRAHHE